MIHRLNKIPKPPRISGEAARMLKRIQALREQCAEHGIPVDSMAEAQAFARRFPEIFIAIARHEAAVEAAERERR